MDFGALFEEDSVLREIDDEWSDDELLQKSGMFRFTKVNEKLGINTQLFRHYLNQLDDPERVRREYGVIQDGWWRVRMKTFSEVAPEIREQFSIDKKRRRGTGEPDDYKKLPSELSREEFFKLRGVYRLKQVAETGYLPYGYRDLVTRLTKGDPPPTREVTGCWTGSRFRLVDMVPFFTWVLSQYRGISLEEARQLSEDS